MKAQGTRYRGQERLKGQGTRHKKERRNKDQGSSTEEISNNKLQIPIRNQESVNFEFRKPNCEQIKTYI